MSTVNRLNFFSKFSQISICYLTFYHLLNQTQTVNSVSVNKWVNPASAWLTALQWRGQEAAVMPGDQERWRVSCSVQTAGVWKWKLDLLIYSVVLLRSRVTWTLCVSNTRHHGDCTHQRWHKIKNAWQKKYPLMKIRLKCFCWLT